MVTALRGLSGSTVLFSIFSGIFFASVYFTGLASPFSTMFVLILGFLGMMSLLSNHEHRVMFRISQVGSEVSVVFTVLYWPRSSCAEDRCCDVALGHLD